MITENDEQKETSVVNYYLFNINSLHVFKVIDINKIAIIKEDEVLFAMCVNTFIDPTNIFSSLSMTKVTKDIQKFSAHLEYRYQSHKATFVTHFPQLLMVVVYNQNVSVLQELDKEIMFSNIIIPFRRYYNDQHPSMHAPEGYGFFFCITKQKK